MTLGPLYSFDQVCTSLEGCPSKTNNRLAAFAAALAEIELIKAGNPREALAQLKKNQKL